MWRFAAALVAFALTVAVIAVVAARTPTAPADLGLADLGLRGSTLAARPDTADSGLRGSTLAPAADAAGSDLGGSPLAAPTVTPRADVRRPDGGSTAAAPPAMAAPGPPPGPPPAPRQPRPQPKVAQVPRAVPVSPSPAIVPASAAAAISPASTAAPAAPAAIPAPAAATAATGSIAAAPPLPAPLTAPPLSAPAVAAPAVEYQRPVTNRLNTTGKPLSLPVPLKDGGRELGDIVMRVEPDDAIFLPRQAILEKLGKRLSPEARARLEGLPQTDGRIALSAMREAKLGLEFNQGAFELVFDPAASQRAEGELSVGGLRGPVATEPTAEPAKLAAYLNVIGGVDQQWQTAGQQGQTGRPSQTGGHLDLQGAVRMRGVVLETDATVDGAVDANRCAFGSTCTYQHTEGLKRQRTRLTYDMPEPQLRLQAGDTETSFGGAFVRPIDTLGLSLQKSAAKLAPGESIRSVGRGTFRVDRQSEVDVIVNGAVVQHFSLRPGSYNLRDLPYTSGANDVELAITDDSGERKSLKFSTFYDQALLGAGKNEWSISGGIPSYIRDGDRQYDASQRTGVAQLRHGLTDDITADASLQADTHVVTGALGATAQTRVGVIGVQPAASTTDGRVGVGGQASWSMAGFRGAFGWRESLRLSADYRATRFRTPGDQIDLATQVFRPQSLYKLRLTGAHSISLPADLTASLSVRYQFDNPEATALSPYIVRGDRYGADVTLSKPLTSWASASVLAGYSNETYLNGFAGNYTDARPAFRAAVRVSIRPEERTSVAASYDTLNQTSQVMANRSGGDGIGRWDASASANHVGATGDASVGGSVGYTANRAEVRASHSAGFTGLAGADGKLVDTGDRSSLRVGTAIAFADGAVAVGAPVRGGAFAIVQPHPSIAGKEVTVGSDGVVQARTDRLGPALVSTLPAYANANVPVDVADLPVGYSLGAGSFDLAPAYKDGYRLEVGSAYAITAYGTLVDQAGLPLALQSGTATAAANAKKQVTVFTNAVGRFGIDGLAPGRWTLQIDSASGPLVYAIDIPAGTEGLFKAGTLAPVGGSFAKEG